MSRAYVRDPSNFKEYSNKTNNVLEKEKERKK